MKSKIENLVQTDREQRRRFLRLFGTAAALLPVTAIIGCSDDQPSAPASATQASDPEPQQSPPADPQPAQPAETASSAEPATEDLERLSLDDPTAKALGYKHDAANVDLESYPQRGRSEAANHYCSNCALFQARDGEEWGTCTLFQGKLVNANGWCSGYAPRPA